MNYILIQILIGAIGIGIGCVLLFITLPLLDKRQNKYSRIRYLQSYLDIVGDSNDKEAVNELGLLLHGKKEWTRRQEQMRHIKENFSKITDK